MLQYSQCCKSFATVITSLKMLEVVNNLEPFMKEPCVTRKTHISIIKIDFWFLTCPKEKKKPTGFMMFILTSFSVISNYYFQLVLTKRTYDEHSTKAHCTLKEFNGNPGHSTVKENLHERMTDWASSGLTKWCQDPFTPSPALPLASQTQNPCSNWGKHIRNWCRNQIRAAPWPAQHTFFQ